MAIECEAKIAIENLNEVREKLYQITAKYLHKVLEINTIYDNQKSELFDKQILLRVRQCNNEKSALITVKKTLLDGKFKKREEIETVVESADMFKQQLKALGYEKKIIYEKIRETWVYEKANIALDTCPEIGNFIEVESDEESIGKILEKLGFKPEKHIKESYIALWEKYCKEQSRNVTDMVFSNKDKLENEFFRSCSK